MDSGSRFQSMRALVYMPILMCMYVIGLVPEPAGQVPEAGATEHSEGIIGSEFEWRIQRTLAHRLTPVTGRQWIQWTNLREKERENVVTRRDISEWTLKRVKAAVIMARVLPDSCKIKNTHDLTYTLTQG